VTGVKVRRFSDWFKTMCEREKGNGGRLLDPETRPGWNNIGCELRREI